MKKFLIVVRGEILKQHRNWFHSYFVYFSLLIWPVLLFFNAFYTYKAFDIKNNFYLYGMNSEQALIIFLVTGFIGYNCFWSMVQSAWQMRFERANGTLETILLSPANRLSIIYGRALGSLLENIWLFSLFGIFMLVISKSISVYELLFLPIIFFILILSATIWGGFMNAIFLFSRDASFVFNILDEPMVLFSGVRIPISVFPHWAKIIAIVFPLTHSLVVMRSIFLGKNAVDLFPGVINLCITLIILVILTIVVLHLAEKNARKTGNLNFY